MSSSSKAFTIANRVKSSIITWSDYQEFKLIPTPTPWNILKSRYSMCRSSFATSDHLISNRPIHDRPIWVSSNCLTNSIIAQMAANFLSIKTVSTKNSTNKPKPLRRKPFPMNISEHLFCAFSDSGFWWNCAKKEKRARLRHLILFSFCFFGIQSECLAKKFFCANVFKTRCLMNYRQSYSNEATGVKMWWVRSRISFHVQISSNFHRPSTEKFSM